MATRRCDGDRFQQAPGPLRPGSDLTELQPLEAPYSVVATKKEKIEMFDQRVRMLIAVSARLMHIKSVTWVAQTTFSVFRAAHGHFFPFRLFMLPFLLPLLVSVSHFRFSLPLCGSKHLSGIELLDLNADGSRDRRIACRRSCHTIMLLSEKK